MPTRDGSDDRQHDVAEGLPGRGAEVAGGFLEALSKRLNTANMISSPKGSVQVRCAPRPELHQLRSIAQHLEQRADAQRDHDRGHDQAGDRDVEQGGQPAKPLAEGEARQHRETTVSSITITPSSASGRSAADVADRTAAGRLCANQCSETPRIGKVRPPSGPGRTARRSSASARRGTARRARREGEQDEAAGMRLAQHRLTAPCGCRPAGQAPDHQDHGEQEHWRWRLQRELKVASSVTMILPIEAICGRPSRRW